MNLESTVSTSEAAGIDWDVIVIGAGVAGSIAAREVARRGLRVLLADRRSFPRRKVCGACLNAASLEILGQLGLRNAIGSLGGCPLDRYSLWLRSRSVSLSLPGGLALSREAFDSALASSAIDAGAEFLTEVFASLEKTQPLGSRVRLVRNGQQTLLAARSVIIATGLGDISTSDPSVWNSRVSSSSHIGIGCVIPDPGCEYASGTIWMAAEKPGYVGLVRVEEGQLNIAAALDRDWMRSQRTPATAIQQLLQSAGLPSLAGLASADWLGTVALTRSTTPVATDSTFVIGDAAGYVEPFTGEGMLWALLSGRCVARWVSEAVGNERSMAAAVEGWRREHRRLIQSRQWFCRISTSFIRSPILLSAAIEVLSRWPWLAKQAIAQIG